ncbi:hypothetical protein MKZ20_21920 [Psychrobacillus sp. FSL K6-2684]
MYLDSKEKEIILGQYMSYNFDVMDEGDCKLFMWNLEQHLAQKSL